MNLSSIVPAAKFAVGRTSLVLSKHAPDILVGSGIVGFIATAVTASKATLTLGDILDKAIIAAHALPIPLPLPRMARASH